MLIHEMFEAAAKKFSGKIAVSDGHTSLTYDELAKESSRIASLLSSRGVKPGDIVGISLQRSSQMIAALIGILKTGSAYLPLDTEYPSDRLNYMIAHSNVKHLLIDDKAAAIIDGSGCDKINLSVENLVTFDSHSLNAINANLCYVIYTSGSTGKPKGVAMGHGALANLIQWQNTETSLKENSVTLQFTPISFDVHFQEIFSTLTLGGTLILIKEEQRIDPSELIAVMVKNHVNRLYLPFVALNHLAEYAVLKNSFPSSLKEVTTAGEQLKVSPAIRSFFKNLNNAVLFNHYGPSETHVVTSHILNGMADSWPDLPPIGKPISNTGVLILNDEFLEMPKGEEGEIYLSGTCLADGYLHSPDLTQEKFLTLSRYGRIYKTGDVGKVDENGNIIYSGRIDGQIKIRGYRVEPGEIEILILKEAGVNQCAVTLRSENNENYLCAYICGDADINNIRENLRLSLPAYMIPAHFIKISELPLTPSGKVAKKLLPAPSSERPELNVQFAAPEDSIQEHLSELWKKHLHLNQIGIDDNFFDLGGNSLSALKVVLDANQFLEKKITIVNFFQYPTIRKIGEFLKHGKEVSRNYRNKKRLLHNEIAIIGMTGRFPGAANVDELWEVLLAGKSTLSKFSKTEANPSVPAEIKNDPNYVPVEGKFPGSEYFDFKYFGMTPREAELMDPQQRKFLELSVEALELSGCSPEKYPGPIGVFAGMGNSLYGNLVHAHKDKVRDAGEFNVMLGLEKDYVATRTAFKLNLTGPAISLHTGCSTSLVAVIEAVKSLRNLDCDMAIAGGISISGSEKRGHLFQEGGILSKDGLCRPFDDEATGTIFTDGAGILILKRLSDAESDGDNILAVIKGVGINNDGSDKMSFTAPSIQGQNDVILRAHADAGIDASQIGYVEAHGTATPVGDPIEVEALTKAFKNSTTNKSFCYLSSVKSNLGHLTAAAGVTGVIKTVMCLKNKVIPGTANFVKPNKHLNLAETPFIVAGGKSEFPKFGDLRLAGVSSFGVGGTNAHIVLQEYDDKSKEVSKNNKPLLFKISAKNESALTRLEEKLFKALKNLPESQLPSLAYTLETGRTDHSFRKFILLGEGSLQEKFISSKGKFTNKPSLYFAFPGQGSQYKEMGKNLCEKSSIFKSYFENGCSLLKKYANYDLQTVINNPAGDQLNNTFYTQPAVFVIEYALARTMLDLGYKPQALIGHSIGEYTAAALADVFSFEDGIKIIVKRAELVSALPEGIMLSVASPLENVKKLLSGFELDLAAVNAPSSCVVAGDKKEIERFKEFLTRQEVASIELKTSHAFHSRMMKPAVAEFKDFISNIKLSKPSLPIFSTVTLSFETDLLASADYWSEHLINCVSFSPAIEAITKKENVLLLEIGPRPTLTNLARKTFSANDCKKCFAINLLSDNSSNEYVSVLKAVGELWIHGHYADDHGLFYEAHERRKIPGPVYPFEESLCWLDYKQNIKTISISHTEGIQMSSKKSTLITRLTEIFEKSSGIDVSNCGPQMSFLEMGMDSLFLTQIALKLKKEFKTEITFRQLLEEYSSLELLSDFLADKVADEPVAVASPVPVPVSVAVQTPVAQPQAPEVYAPQVSETAAFNTNSAGIESVINRQLELMSQQLQLMRGIPVSSTARAVQPVQAVQAVQSPQPAPVQKPVTIERSKEAFGAAARISTEKSNQISADQLKYLNDFFKDYCAKTSASKKFTQDNRKNHADPRVVTGFKPENKEIVYPIVVKKSLGQKLWDIDGNEYIDMICGFGSNFFGNGNERIKALVQKQIEEGIEVGPQHPLTGDVSKLICELTGNERAAFCNTGSEAVLGAMRIARTVTGREKIIVFSGSYHGINDEVILRSSRGVSYPASPGINDAAVSNMIVLDYGTEESLETIRKISHEVAAVLVEPVQSRRCDFRPVEFLKEVRKITETTETCLIFDEVITGFRIHPAGAQAHFGIRADLCTYGKIVGGGMSIGVVSGKAKYMDALDGGFWQFGDDSTPTVGVTYFAGTFVRHPLALAAAKGALEIIKEGGEKMLSNLTERADNFAGAINALCISQNVPLEMHNFGSLMKPKWKKDVAGGEVLFALLRFNGVHVYDGFPWFVNLAHTQEQLDFVLQAFRKSIMSMQMMGLFPESKFAVVFDAKNAPVPGARIGRDEAGNPAWFMENPAKAGEYLMIEG